MSPTNLILIILVFVVAIAGIMYFINKKKKAEKEIEEEETDIDDKTYTIDKMKEFVKKRLNEIKKQSSYNYWRSYGKWFRYS